MIFAQVEYHIRQNLITGGATLVVPEGTIQINCGLCTLKNSLNIYQIPHFYPTLIFVIKYRQYHSGASLWSLLR
jgi:hypothetical protein